MLLLLFQSPSVESKEDNRVSHASSFSLRPTLAPTLGNRSALLTTDGTLQGKLGGRGGGQRWDGGDDRTEGAQLMQGVP